MKWMMSALLLWVAFVPLAQAFYHPSTGRWLSRDPIEEKGGRNLMTFVTNNPVSLIEGVPKAGMARCGFAGDFSHSSTRRFFQRHAQLHLSGLKPAQ